MPKKQEYDFGTRIKKLLEKAGFVVIRIPMVMHRTQLIDAFAIKNQKVAPIEFKGKQSKYLKEQNAQQLEMQKSVFFKAGTPFFRIIQGNSPGEVRIHLFTPSPGLGIEMMDELRKALELPLV